MTDSFLDRHFGILFTTSLAIAFIILLGGAFYAGTMTSNNYVTAYSEAKHDLQLQGYSVLEGIINSPTVIQTTDNYSYFTTMVQNDTPIYHVLEGKEAYVAVFNATYGLAYYPEYKTVGWWGIGIP